MNLDAEPAESAGPLGQAALKRLVADQLDAEQGSPASVWAMPAPAAASPALAEERSRLLSDRLGVGFWQRDVASGALDWDAQMFRIHRREPALGAPTYVDWIEVCVHALDRAWVAEALARAEADWLPLTDLCFRARVPDDQGGERWVQTWGRRLSVNGQRVSFGMHVEVSNHQREQRLLAHERERTRYAIAAAEVGVWECDPDGRLSHANEVMYRQLGLDTSTREPGGPAALSKHVRSLTRPDDWRHLQDRLRRRLASGEPFRHELPLHHSRPQPRWLALQGRALRGPDGRICGMAGVQIDITERKQAETLQLEKQRLEQASRDKSLFMARMSHELRTPMNAVLGFTRLLEDDPLEPPSPRQRERLTRIAQAGDRLLALIDDLLDLARLDTETDAGPALPLSLAELLREACAAVASEAERAGVRLQWSRDVSGAAQGDRRRLVQALGHVLLKVLPHCTPGSELVLQAGLEADTGGSDTAALPAGDESSAEAEAVAVVRIFDPAPPVPGQPWLFDPVPAEPGVDGAQRDTAVDTAFDAGLDTVFSEALDSPADCTAPLAYGHQASDIGLSLALRLVRAVGGRIDTRELPADGPASAGTARRVHVLRLPAAAGQARPLRSAPQRAEQPAPALRVLCVEDNPVNLQLVREVFALRPRVQLRTAVDGASGLAEALAEPPDLVLMDLQLPDMNGTEVLRRLRAQPQLAGCLVIALSADAMPEHIAAGRAAGFDDYWTKPIQFDRFLADIDRLADACAAGRMPGR